MATSQPTRSDQISDAYRRERAMQLRLAGATFDQIAEQLGFYNRGVAYRSIRNEIAKIGAEERDELRDLDLARLDKLMMAVWPQAMRGEMNAVDRVLKIIERRARMCGYEQPSTVINNTSDGETTVTVTRRLSDVLQGLSGTAEQELGRTLHELLPTEDLDGETVDTEAGDQ